MIDGVLPDELVVGEPELDEVVEDEVLDDEPELDEPAELVPVADVGVVDVPMGALEPVNLLTMLFAAVVTAATPAEAFPCVNGL